jgi:sulfonate transport system ATP-binding protein
MKPLAETRRLTVRRGGQAVLRDADLRIAPGEFVAIVGKSGSGKSTLLHALAGHLAFSGEMTVPRRIGMVFQRYALFPWMTVEQNVAFGLTLDGAEKAGRIRECMQTAGLTEKAGAYPAELSGGQQQRAAIARALAHRPELLLLDEPFGSLDAITRLEMHEWVRTVRTDASTAMLLVTHDIDEARTLADRILILKDGVIVAELSPSAGATHEEIRKML